MRFAFGEDEVKRIAKAVKTVEQNLGTSDFQSTGPRLANYHLSIVKVTSTGNPFHNGNRVEFDSSGNLLNSKDQCFIKDINGSNLPADSYHVGFFGGYNSGNPVFLVNSASESNGGNAVIDVVTDVYCTPTGLEVTKATFSGANYDNAVIKTFLSLTDVVPVSYLGEQGRAVVVNSTGTGLTFGDVIGQTPDSFIGLSDTPELYGTSNTYKVLTVSSDNGSIVFSANNITCQKSVTGGGNPNNPNFKSITLVNDELNPISGSFYGCLKDSRGWHKITFLNLDDAPDSFKNNKGKIVSVKSSEDALEFVDNEFLKLVDCPSEYTKFGGNFLKVKNDETGIEFSQLNLTEIENSIISLTTLTTDHETRITTLENSVAGILLSITTIESDIIENSNSITTLQNQTTSIQSTITTIESNISSLTTDILTNTASITSLNLTVTSIQSDISSINTTLTDHQNRIVTLESSSLSMASDITSIQSTITTIESDISSLTTDVQTVSADIVNINSSITSIQSDVSQLQTSDTQNTLDIADILTRLSAAETAITSIQSDVSQLQTDLANAQSDITNNYSSLDARLVALGG